MADPVAVRHLRATADLRLIRAVKAAADRTGVPYHPPQVPEYERDLKAARTIEAVADFVERLNQQETKR